jgi:hypothetical protein
MVKTSVCVDNDFFFRFRSLRIDLGALTPANVVDVRDLPLPPTPEDTESRTSSSATTTTTTTAATTATSSSSTTTNAGPSGVAVRLDELVPDVTLASVSHVEFSALDLVREVCILENCCFQIIVVYVCV